MALNRQAFAFTVIPPVVLAAALVVLRPARWDAMRVTGLVLTIAGFGLMTIARTQLGNSFSITPQARALVTTGLYRKVRNPVYVFAAIVIAGFVMYVGRPKLLLLLLVLIPMQVIRARAEGRKLEAAFGEEYRAWKRQTWF
jgi:protein-S-isoprenylcysteine O-methyltransferase Ste14